MKIIDKDTIKKLRDDLKNLKIIKFFRELIKYSWEGSDLFSYLPFIVLVFFSYKLIIEPLFMLVLATKVPLNTIISQSMSHNGLDFEEWWEKNSIYMQKYGISKEDFIGFDYKDGLEIGDFVMVKGIDKNDVKLGQIIVYPANWAGRDLEIVHRVVRIFNNSNGEICFETLGDNNKGLQLPFEKEICEIDGVVFFRIPYIGYPRYLLYKFVKI